MITEKNQENEFIIPTRYKLKIGSHFSWPIGAMELTKNLPNVPQLKELQITFVGGGSKFAKGKEPITFPVIEARFSYDRKQSAILEQMNFSKWALYVYPVPRTERAEIKKSLKQNGFEMLVNWFIKYSRFTNNEGNWSFIAIWNSELKELSFNSRDYVLPEIQANNRENKHEHSRQNC